MNFNINNPSTLNANVTDSYTLQILKCMNNSLTLSTGPCFANYISHRFKKHL